MEDEKQQFISQINELCNGVNTIKDKIHSKNQLDDIYNKIVNTKELNSITIVCNTREGLFSVARCLFTKYRKSKYYRHLSLILDMLLKYDSRTFTVENLFQLNSLFTTTEYSNCDILIHTYKYFRNEKSICCNVQLFVTNNIVIRFTADKNECRRIVFIVTKEVPFRSGDSVIDFKYLFNTIELYGEDIEVTSISER